jgi:trans-aconitate methyltransferase
MSTQTEAQTEAPPQASIQTQTWNTAAYAANGRFVANLASEIVALLNPQPNERILDIGCGDGALTEQLAATGAQLTGIDASPTMLDAARTRIESSPHPFTVIQSNAEDLASLQPAGFDAAFSNAALHWIPAARQPLALAAIHAVLRPGGRFVAEMGGQGNIASIRAALSATLQPFGIDAEHAAASFYPSPAEYRTLLEAAGFTVHTIAVHPRPTPLPNGPEAMTLWLNTFRNGVLDQLAPTDRATVITRTVAILKPILSDPTGAWTGDYVRLRFHATRA